MLEEEPDIKLGPESKPVRVLTEGSLHNSEGILHELKERPIQEDLIQEDPGMS